MGNIQGRRHRRKSKRISKINKTIESLTIKDVAQGNKMVFVDREDGMYVWENHEFGRLPLKEPEDCEIIFYGDKLWQDDSDKWSLLVLTDDDDDGYFADDEIAL